MKPDIIILSFTPVTGFSATQSPLSSLTPSIHPSLSLSTDGLASVDKTVCDKYDRHWIITREEVETHRSWLLCKNDVDCDAAAKFPGYEGSIPDIILNWPAHGAEGELPYALAPFIDLDGDQYYDPLEDYPSS